MDLSYTRSVNIFHAETISNDGSWSAVSPTGTPRDLIGAIDGPNLNLAEIVSATANPRLEVDIGRMVEVVGVIVHHDLLDLTRLMDGIDVKVKCLLRGQCQSSMVVRSASHTIL